MDRMDNQAGRDGTGDMAKDLRDSAASPTQDEANPFPKSSGTPGNPVDSGNEGSGGRGDVEEDDGTTNVISFLGSFKDGKVFKLEDNSDGKNIGFSKTDSKAVLDKIKWQVMKRKENQEITLGTAKFKTSKFDGQFSACETRGCYEDDMYIQIDWKKNGATGYTRTELFTVTNITENADKLTKELASDERNEKPLETTIMPETASATSEPSASSEPNVSSSGSGGGGGGLSTGATAGIAVGAVIGGLLLIGALAWFFLRRRRRNQRAGDEYVTQQTYAMDKETHGRGADSLNSPYSDENHMQPVVLGNLDHERGAAPTPPPAGAPRSSFGSHDRGGNNGIQTPQGMSRNVAHLVEDGMTADEIRRLEEEERQLDDEIERAARR
ncbi:hypothetical protein FHETE_4994 [Fusarium heterosporum]|uniref:Uncharacterized protein n=1 Tax=Fusarium heterosporum TaxID=42747 RepID=A0A8H5TDP3_FUSHE|nr:hypothetical protein FHETE_4994 [Fusarium heterosporum]